MPCTPDTICNRVDSQNYAQPNNVPSPTGHYANMGWVGFVNLRIPSLGADNILRVLSADVNLKQEITTPDTIDGRIDKTTYQLGSKNVDGTLSMPLVADLPSANVGDGCPTVQELTVAGSLLQNIWCWATARGPHGRLLYNDAALDIRYANHAAFTFDTAVVNTLSMSVAAEDMIKFDINIMGRGRSTTNFNDVTSDPPIRDFLSPARVLTWNDITVNGVGGCSNAGDLFYSNQVREFNLEINNNAARFYSFNGSLYPVDVNVGKRDITGSLKLLGFQHKLRVLAEENQSRFTEKNEIRMAMYIGNDQFQGGAFVPRDWTGSGSAPSGNPIFYKKLTGVVFEIEEVSMTNDVLETTVNWKALASDQSGYQAFTPSNCSFPKWA